MQTLINTDILHFVDEHKVAIFHLDKDRWVAKVKINNKEITSRDRTPYECVAKLTSPLSIKERHLDDKTPWELIKDHKLDIAFDALVNQWLVGRRSTKGVYLTEYNTKLKFALLQTLSAIYNPRTL
jgi:hypothetical protein